MRKIQIVTDSTSDLNGELLEKYGIDYCRMSTVLDGKETEATLTWDNCSPEDFYQLLRDGNRITTTQVPVSEFVRVFNKYIDEGCDIIYLACSNRQSGSINTSIVVAKDVLKEHPEAKIACIDALRAGPGEGMLAIYAAEKAAAGADFDELVEDIKKQRLHINQFMTMYSLDSFRRAGRVENSEAYQSNLMAVKPILIADANGAQVPVRKVRGRAASLTEIADMLAEAGGNDATQGDTIFIGHADCLPEDVEAVRERLNEKCPDKKVLAVYIGPIVGASVGPDCIGVWGWGNEVTYKAGEAK